MLGLLAGHAQRRDVDEHQVVVGAARDDTRAETGQGLGHDRGVLDGPSLVVAEGLLGGQLEGDGLAGDHLHQRTALDAREGRSVDRSGERAVSRTVLDGREVRCVQPGPERRGG